MPVTASQVASYSKKLNSLKREAIGLLASSRVAVNKATEFRRMRIKDLIDSRIRDDGVITTSELPPLRDAIKVEVDAMIDEANAVLVAQKHAAFDLAVQKGSEVAAMDLGGEAMFFAPSTDLLVISSQFTADYVRTIGADLMGEVNQILGRTAVGGLQPYEAMRNIDKLIGKSGATGVSYQAERIVRTEVQRIYSLTLDSSFTKFAEQMTNPKAVKKTWVSGPYRAGRREEHQEMDGQTVPIDEPFQCPSGAVLMYPGDPQGDPGETINCGCTWILNAESIATAVLETIDEL
jgi:hypothetical protein